ncbi:MAG: HAMP domain-containing sensor histidine kinase [Ilumatobacteraceae bacterium]
MTRRLTLVITSVILATLLVAGFGAIVVGNLRARQVTRTELRQQSVEIAANLSGVLDNDTAENPAALKRRLGWLRIFRETLDLDGFAIFSLRADGVLAGDEAPAGFDLTRLSVERLRRGDVIDGSTGRLAFAAAPTMLPNGRVLVVVLTRTASPGTRAALDTFLLAGLATLVIGMAIAVAIGRRLTRPIREASEATNGIARGELSTRLKEPPAHRHDELSDLARSVNVMASELERSRILEQQFLLSVSHDLRTPLTSIRGYAEAITDGAGDPQRAALVIRSEARRLERLVADLLDLAKLRAKAFSLRTEPVDLVALATVACEAFAPEAAERRIDLHQNPPPGSFAAAPVIVAADHDRMAQVAANLVENALKFATTEVIVTVEQAGETAVFAVDDDGPGIARDDLAHVFERLYVARSQPARHESSSGLGLAIVKELVEAMGATVSATQSRIGGARMEVRLAVALRTDWQPPRLEPEPSADLAGQ